MTQRPPALKRILTLLKRVSILLETCLVAITNRDLRPTSNTVSIRHGKYCGRSSWPITVHSLRFGCRHRVLQGETFLLNMRHIPSPKRDVVPTLPQIYLTFVVREMPALSAISLVRAILPRWSAHIAALRVAFSSRNRAQCCGDISLLWLSQSDPALAKKYKVRV